MGYQMRQYGAVENGAEWTQDGSAGASRSDQGDAADSIIYVQKGRDKLTVVSRNGIEATISLLAVGDFVDEESLASVAGLRMATAASITACTALAIERHAMIRVAPGPK
jgi:CRP-like cAMP-binding protein